MAKESKFIRSDTVGRLSSQDTFSANDVGLTNPYNDNFIKLGENGIIEIYAGNGTGIILNPNARSITFTADSIKFMTNKEDGMRWNDMSFNSQATSYTEPPLIPYEQETRPNAFRDLDDYLEDD